MPVCPASLLSHIKMFLTQKQYSYTLDRELAC